MIKIFALTLCIAALSQCVNADDDFVDLRLLISEYSEVKKDYLLTKDAFIKSGSSPDQFGKTKWTIPDIVKRAEKHLDETQLPQIAPAMSKGWPRGEARNDLGYPIASGELQFKSIELCEHGEFLYWKVNFWLTQPIGGTFSIFVACYLDGTIAKIVDHEPENGD